MMITFIAVPYNSDVAPSMGEDIKHIEPRTSELLVHYISKTYGHDFENIYYFSFSSYILSNLLFSVKEDFYTHKTNSTLRQKSCDMDNYFEELGKLFQVLFDINDWRNQNPLMKVYLVNKVGD